VLGAAFWGPLFGFLLIVPLIGMPIGAAMGALAGSPSQVSRCRIERACMGEEDRRA
jgi:uncharacterized membrane protein